MKISSVNNHEANFKALKKIQLSSMASTPPLNGVNKILTQFKENEIFQKFCNKYDVNLYINSHRTVYQDHPFECSVIVDYKPCKQSKGFFSSLVHLFTASKEFIHSYSPKLSNCNKWEVENGFANTLEYKNIIEQMKMILAKETSEDDYNNIVKSMLNKK